MVNYYVLIMIFHSQYRQQNKKLPAETFISVEYSTEGRNDSESTFLFV